VEHALVAGHTAPKIVMRWSPQQAAALKAVASWLAGGSGSPWFYLAGWAGSGKTTLAIEMANLVKGGRVCYAAFTGKAALVMRRKGCHNASTIHKLIYSPYEDEDGSVRFLLNPNSNLKDAGLLIVDECSMVDEKLGRDLLSFCTPILVLGDPAQLPPVHGEGFFTAGAPHVMLTEIHRQAAGNPILALATKAREGGFLPRGAVVNTIGAAAVVKWEDVPVRSKLAADQIIAGTNVTRRKINRDMREMLREAGQLPQPPGLAPDWMPVEGDKLICLRNNHDVGLLNGSLWRVDTVHSGELPPRPSGLPRKRVEGIVYMTVSSLDDDFDGVEIQVPRAFFQGKEDDLPPRFRRAYHEFTFGYCITCHKSQGSQWGNVLVRDQGFIFKEMMHRWRYTAITRAAEKLIVGH
jgi:exodeoxyribonuclease V